MESLPEAWERGLAIVAHPDDLEYGTASAVARWTQQGKQVSYLLVTSGEAGIDSLDPVEAKPLREEEERRGAGIVGVTHVEFLGHADGFVEYGLGLRRDIARAIRHLRPEIVVTMNFELTWGADGGVNHADHRATGLAVLDACRDAANRWMFPEDGEPWQGTQAVYVAGMGPPTHFVDVTDTIGAGVESLRAHDAYLRGLGSGFDPESFLRGSARAGGQTAGCEMAVGFRRLSV